MKEINNKIKTIEKKEQTIRCNACGEITFENEIVMDIINEIVYCPRCWKSHIEIEKILKN